MVWGTLNLILDVCPAHSSRKSLTCFLRIWSSESGGMNSEIVQGSALSPVERSALLFDWPVSTYSSSTPGAWPHFLSQRTWFRPADTWVDMRPRSGHEHIPASWPKEAHSVPIWASYWNYWKREALFLVAERLRYSPRAVRGHLPQMERTCFSKTNRKKADAKLKYEKSLTLKTCLEFPNLSVPELPLNISVIQINKFQFPFFKFEARLFEVSAPCIQGKKKNLARTPVGSWRKAHPSVPRA